MTRAVPRRTRLSSRRRLWLPAAMAALLAVPAVAGEAVTLPEGPLQLVAGGRDSAAFIVLDQTSKTENLADVWIYQALDPPLVFSADRVEVQMLRHWTIDCAAHSFAELASFGFDEKGQILVTLPAGPSETIGEGSAEDHVAAVLCDGHPVPVSNTVQGHAAALKAARAILRAQRG